MEKAQAIEIHKTSNGYIVITPFDPRKGALMGLEFEDTYTFETYEALNMWLQGHFGQRVTPTFNLLSVEEHFIKGKCSACGMILTINERVESAPQAFEAHLKRWHMYP